LLEDVIAQHDAIKHVRLLRLLVWKSAAMREREREKGGFRDGVGVWSGDGWGDDDARSVATVVLHYLERVDEEDKEQMAKQMLVVRFRWPSSTGRVRSISAYQGQKQQTLSDLCIPASHFPNQHIRNNMHTPFTTSTPQC
jgi:hypothetical protein